MRADSFRPARVSSVMKDVVVDVGGYVDKCDIISLLCCWVDDGPARVGRMSLRCINYLLDWISSHEATSHL